MAVEIDFEPGRSRESIKPIIDQWNEQLEHIKGENVFLFKAYSVLSYKRNDGGLHVGPNARNPIASYQPFDKMKHSYGLVKYDHIRLCDDFSEQLPLVHVVGEGEPIIGNEEYSIPIVSQDGIYYAAPTAFPSEDSNFFLHNREPIDDIGGSQEVSFAVLFGNQCIEDLLGIGEEEIADPFARDTIAKGMDLLMKINGKDSDIMPQYYALLKEIQ